MRKLASIQRIRDLVTHPDADRLEIATILGWQCVVEKGKFQKDDLVVWFEIDSWIPTEIAPFLTKPGHEPKVYEGVQGERLRTVKLRGQISAGLILPLTLLGKISEKEGKHFIELLDSYGEINDRLLGFDLTQTLGILKYEPPIPAQLAGQVKGLFPSFIRKTDQERCLSGDTIITTRLGRPKKIEDIAVGETVLSMHEDGRIGWGEVTNVSSMRNNRDWIRVWLEDGTHLDMTPNHRVFLPELNCYRLCSELTMGDILLKNGLPESVLQENTDELPNLLEDFAHPPNPENSPY